MIGDVSVIIPAIGDPAWSKKAHEGAYPSAANQSVTPREIFIVERGSSIASARNWAAERAGTEWLCFLDADDRLDPRYVEHMLAVNGDLRRPATLGIYEDGTEDDFPVLIPRTNMRNANCVVIGAFVRREQFLKVGGFRDLPVLEDWDLWIRVIQDGAVLTDVPEAIYRVMVRPDGRNQNVKAHHKVYQDIRRRYW